MSTTGAGGHLGYTIAKYGMSLTTLGLAEELKDDGVAVNSTNSGGLVLDDPARFAGAAILYGTLPFGAGLTTVPGRLAHLPVLVACLCRSRCVPSLSHLASPGLDPFPTTALFAHSQRRQR